MAPAIWPACTLTITCDDATLDRTGLEGAEWFMVVWLVIRAAFFIAVAYLLFTRIVRPLWRSLTGREGRRAPRPTTPRQWALVTLRMVRQSADLETYNLAIGQIGTMLKHEEENGFVMAEYVPDLVEAAAERGIALGEKTPSLMQEYVNSLTWLKQFVDVEPEPEVAQHAPTIEDRPRGLKAAEVFAWHRVHGVPFPSYREVAGGTDEEILAGIPQSV